MSFVTWILYGFHLLSIFGMERFNYLNWIIISKKFEIIRTQYLNIFLLFIYWFRLRIANDTETTPVNYLYNYHSKSLCFMLMITRFSSLSTKQFSLCAKKRKKSKWISNLCCVNKFLSLATIIATCDHHHHHHHNGYCCWCGGCS